MNINSVESDEDGAMNSVESDEDGADVQDAGLSELSEQSCGDDGSSSANDDW